MIYIISEQQNERFLDLIFSYLDSNLTPFLGWESSRKYKEDLLVDDEIFFHIVESDGSGEDAHMWYSLHTNPHATVPKEVSPLITLPSVQYNSLDGFFGDFWKPIFKKWFEENTGLRLKTIDKQGW
jgi:hypothetical protein